jgi:quinol monooxygenase YgiN
MLVNAVIYTFPEDRAEEAKRILTELRDLSRKEEGCIAFDVARAIDNANVFILHELWKDKAALDLHYTTEHFTRLGVNGIRTLAQERIGYLAVDI